MSLLLLRQSYLLVQVQKFEYKGKPIAEDGNVDKEIRAGIKIARSGFIQMNEVMTVRGLSPEKKDVT